MDPLLRSRQLVSQAARAHSQGLLADTERLVSEALTLDPTDSQAKLLLGVVLTKSGRFLEAQKALEEVLAQDPASFFANYWLFTALRQLGHREQAVGVGMRALNLNPDDVQALIDVGSCLLDLKRYNEAGPIFKRALRLASNNPAAHEGFGLALQGVGKEQDAIQAFKVAFQLDPKSESVGLRLGTTLLSIQDFPAAEACSRAVLTEHPDSPRAHSLLARVLMDRSRGAAALEHAKKALELSPSDASTQVVYGSVLQNLGRIETAHSSFRRAIELDPHSAHAYFALTHNHKFLESDEHILEQMLALKKDPDMDRPRQAQLQYALGKAHHDLARYEAAMRHYDAANGLTYKLRFQDRTYNRKAHEKGFDFVRSTLTKEFLEANLSKNESDVPIFVIGMMRSGTTLVEQILSSHSQVGAAGEQSFWPENYSKVLGSGRAFNRSEAARLGAEYVEVLRAVDPKGRHVVDKMPVNYSFAGVIHSALPNAKFIHIQRHPVDTCLSIYFTPNRSRIEWTNDKSNITFAYQQYLKIMQHWSSAIPENRLLHVKYEDLILQRESTTERMLEFVGLPWEDQCLYPEQNDRSVLTPSVWQVRQPVYTSSLERWRKYEPWLGEFGELL